MELEVNVTGLDLNETLMGVVVRQARGAAEPFGGRIQRVEVSFVERPGPFARVDSRCRIEAEVHPVGRIAIQETRGTAFQAIAAASLTFARATRRRLTRYERRRAATTEGTLA